MDETPLFMSIQLKKTRVIIGSKELIIKTHSQESSLYYNILNNCR